MSRMRVRGLIWPILVTPGSPSSPQLPLHGLEIPWFLIVAGDEAPSTDDSLFGIWPHMKLLESMHGPSSTM